MGVKERKQREKEVLREKIIESASGLFLERGFKATSIRMIAEEIEYSVGAIYSYFKDKNDIFQAIMLRAFDLFYQTIVSQQHIEEPLARLKAMNHAYLQFALDNPAYYDLIFVLSDPVQRTEDDPTRQQALKGHKLLTQVVQDCKDAGYFAGQDPDVLALHLWSTLHGLVTLNLRGRLFMESEEATQQAMEAVLASANHTLDLLR